MRSYIVHYEIMEHTIGPVIHRTTGLEISSGGDEREKLQKALEEFENRRVLLVDFQEELDAVEEAEFYLTAADWI